MEDMRTGASPQQNSRPTGISSIVDTTWTGCERTCEAIKRMMEKSPTRSKPNIRTSNWPAKEVRSYKKILDPHGKFLQIWNKIFVLSCVIAVSLDPLFYYIPVVDSTENCLGLDPKLKTIACVLRSCTDIFYIVHIIFEFRTGFIAPSSLVFGRGEVVKDPCLITRRYLSSYFLIDVLSILPIPQVVLLHTIPLKWKEPNPNPLVIKEWLKYAIICQYVPRIFRIRALWKQATSTAGMFTGTAWAGAAFNLLLYMLASHVVGALWYLFSVERQDQCWREACKKQANAVCDYKYLYCEEGRPRDASFLKGPLKFYCLLTERRDEDEDVFDFGMFLDALKSHVAEKGSRKFFYCFWWGLRNLSSFGKNLETSTYVGEIIFALFISVFGLVLFSSLIGNMQKYIQSSTSNVRLEEMRVRRQDVEQWMSHRMLPESLRDRIRQYEQYRWQQNRGVVEETLIRNLPRDLRRDIKRHLCLNLLRRVPMVEKMDERLLDAICDHLRPVLYTEGSYILREGDPVDEMLFVMRGSLLTSTTNGGMTGFVNSVHLKAGDFCGEELLTWALEFHSSPRNLPTSTRTVQAVTPVEAFALVSIDLKLLVGSQSQPLHSLQLEHAFRFYSQQWRTWAACYIQAVWRRYVARKLDRALREAEYMHLQEGCERTYKSSLLLLPPKPTNPDFTAGRPAGELS